MSSMTSVAMNNGSTQSGVERSRRLATTVPKKANEERNGFESKYVFYSVVATCEYAGRLYRFSFSAADGGRRTRELRDKVQNIFRNNQNTRRSHPNLSVDVGRTARIQKQLIAKANRPRIKVALPVLPLLGNGFIQLKKCCRGTTRTS